MRQVKNRGFTLLELLIVIAVLAILSVVVVLVLNPAETLKKARDSQRMADLNTIKTAIGLYITSTSTPYLGAAGTSNTGCGTGVSHYVWYSKSGTYSDNTIDTNGTTATTSASAANIGNVDGTGWIPVNLTSLTGGSPISNWPIDPINTITSGSAITNSDYVYRYGCASSNVTFELNARLESDAYVTQDPKATTDGGNNSTLYEIGTSLNILGSGNDF